MTVPCSPASSSAAICDKAVRNVRLNVVSMLDPVTCGPTVAPTSNSWPRWLVFWYFWHWTPTVYIAGALFRRLLPRCLPVHAWLSRQWACILFTWRYMRPHSLHCSPSVCTGKCGSGLVAGLGNITSSSSNAHCRSEASSCTARMMAFRVLGTSSWCLVFKWAANCDCTMPCAWLLQMAMRCAGKYSKMLLNCSILNVYKRYL